MRDTYPILQKYLFNLLRKSEVKNQTNTTDYVDYKKIFSLCIKIFGKIGYTSRKLTQEVEKSNSRLYTLDYDLKADQQIWKNFDTMIENIDSPEFFTIENLKNQANICGVELIANFLKQIDNFPYFKKEDSLRILKYFMRIELPDSQRIKIIEKLFKHDTEWAENYFSEIERSWEAEAKNPGETNKHASENDRKAMHDERRWENSSSAKGPQLRIRHPRHDRRLPV